MQRAAEPPLTSARLDHALRAPLPTCPRAAVVVTTGEGKIIYWNAHAERLLGWSTREVYRRQIQDLGPRHVRDRTAEFLALIYANGRPWCGQIVGWRPTRPPYRLFTLMIPLGDLAHGRGALIGVSVPIAQRRGLARDAVTVAAELKRRLGLRKREAPGAPLLVARPPPPSRAAGVRLPHDPDATRRLSRRLREQHRPTDEWSRMQQVELLLHRAHRLAEQDVGTSRARRLSAMWRRLARTVQDTPI